MDLLDSILGTNGCNVDGSISRNPLTQLIDSVFDNPLLTGEGQPGGDYVGQQLNYFEANYQQQQQLQQQQQQQQQFSDQAVAPQSNAAGFMSGGFQAPQHPFMMNQMGMMPPAFFAPSPYMMQPMMGASPYFNAQQQNSTMTQIHEEEEVEEYAEKEAQESVEEQEEQYDGFVERGFEEDSAEARLRSIVQGQQDHLKEEDGPSLEGYQRAWDDLSTKLETGQANTAVDEYFFHEDNPYLQSSEASGLTEEGLEDLFKDAMALYQQGKINQAIQAFEAVVQTRQNSSDYNEQDSDESWRMLGLCHAENDEDRKAIVCLNKSIDCDPYNLDTLLALGTSYVNELDSTRALDTLKNWVTHNPRFQGLGMQHDAYSDGTLMDEVLFL